MTNDDKPKQLYHYQEEAIQQLLQRGETISLGYVVTEEQSVSQPAEAAHD